ncbi:MAG: GNAT family N-acetyltransferase [Rhodoglobus sp.]
MVSDNRVDDTSAVRLRNKGLHLDLVDTQELTEFAAWLRADRRGFHLAEPDEQRVKDTHAGIGDRRTTGVWDSRIPEPSIPIATVSSWKTEMTVPGHRTVPAWAISSVTVAPTHRRQGIARALLEAELRTASSKGVPMAILTVSESTIYGRFGFAPAAYASTLTINTRRAKWVGPEASGRVSFMTTAQFRSNVAAVHERVRPTNPGEIPVGDFEWDQIAGIVTEDKNHALSLRAVRYDTAAGELQGLALYRVKEQSQDFAEQTLTVEYLVTETAEAYAALWQYLLDIDLVAQVKGVHRSVDEPLLWQLSDRRGVTEKVWDHLWLRILDVTTALEGRTYSAAGDCILQVHDDLSFAAGNYVLRVDHNGAARVAAITTRAAENAVASVSLGVRELSALYLGGVSAATLAAAGLIIEQHPGSLNALDSMFRSACAPWLSFWF